MEGRLHCPDIVKVASGTAHLPQHAEVEGGEGGEQPSLLEHRGLGVQVEVEMEIKVRRWR